jgi:hypothetical protein
VDHDGAGANRGGHQELAQHEVSQRRLGDDAIDLALAEKIGRLVLHLLLHNAQHSIAAVCAIGLGCSWRR